MKPTAAVAELLDYLKDLGFVDVRVAPAGAAAPGPVSAASPGTPAPSPGGTASERQIPAAAELALVASEAASCRRCRLCEARHQVVFGSGPPDARLMLVGEGPGAEEDRQGLPFVGAAGELLTKIVRSIGLEREQVYIANIVKCRPPGNRDPAPDEIAACRDYLERQIALVRPHLLVALGRVAAQTLLGNELPLGRMRGTWHSIAGIPLRVTYHPAALLRNAAFKRPTWEDMQLIRDRLRELAGPVPGESRAEERPGRD